MNRRDRRRAGTRLDRRIALAGAMLLVIASHPVLAQGKRSPDVAVWEARRAERVVRQFWDAFNRAAWNELDAFVTPTYVHHPPGKSLTLAEFKEGGAWVHRGLANYALTINSLVATDSAVAIRWTARGVHVGSFFGETPTNRNITVQGMHFHTMSHGRIAEDWETIDFDGFKAQLQGKP